MTSAPRSLKDIDARMYYRYWHKSNDRADGVDELCDELAAMPIDDGDKILNYRADGGVDELCDELAAIPIDDPLYGGKIKKRSKIDHLVHAGSATPESEWRRPAAGPLDPSKEDFVFQHTETTYTIDPGTRMPVIRIFGCTEAGQGVLVSSFNARPYFYAEFIDSIAAYETLQRLDAYLSKTARGRNQLERGAAYVISAEPLQRRSIFGYHCNRPHIWVHKITMAHPAHVKAARNSLEMINRAVTHVRVPTYEANVPFELRYMIDRSIHGCQWIRLRAGMYGHSNRAEATTEYELVMTNDHGLVPEMEAQGLAPMRTLSLDIEVKRHGGAAGFPKPAEDPVILVCTALHIHGRTEPVHKAVFALVDDPGGQTVNQVNDADVYVYGKEPGLLLGLRDYIRKADPDCFTGWNINGFDLPFLFGRAKEHDILDAFSDISRIWVNHAYVRPQQTRSKAFGTRESNELVCEGRYTFDGLDYMHRMQMVKYRSYKLDSIAEIVVGDRKVGIDHTQIPILHEGTDEDRTLLAWYCLKDALLPIQILEKLMAHVNCTEQARVTGVPIKWLLSRGQGVKTYSCILRKKGADEIVPSTSPASNATSTSGGYVRDPIAGFYPYPVATLDFSSLYPSIMQAFNICYSTLVSKEWALANLTPDDYWVPEIEDADFVFVKTHICRGILPALLDGLLDQRRYVKHMMKDVDKATQKALHSVLDSRQNALKVVCNSVYGFLKAYILVDPRLMEAVTSYGQTMIKKSAALIEEKYKDMLIVDREACAKLGIDYEDESLPDLRPRKRYSARIIYGDTDSVMVDFGDIPLADVVRLATEAEAMCTAAMEKPNALLFESVKLSALFLKKKRYGSLEILAGDIKPGERIADAKKRAKISTKGLESRRRDNARISADTQKEVLRLILAEGDVKAALEFVRGVIRDIRLRRVDLSKLVITKALTKTTEEYAKGGTKQTHTSLRERIERRAAYTGEVPPVTGDRVPYVMMAGDKKAKASDLSEDPQYAIRHGVPIDTDYYIKKQVLPATLSIFTGIMEAHKLPVLDGNKITDAVAGLEAYKFLFGAGHEHMREMRIPTVKTNAEGHGITRFCVVLPQCAAPGCHVKITRETRSNVVCDDHYEERDAILDSRLNERAAKEDIVTKAWDRCKNCAGGGFSKVACSNITCDNFFHRRQCVVDVEEVDRVLERFKLPERPERPERRAAIVLEKPPTEKRAAIAKKRGGRASAVRSNGNAKKRG